MKGRVLVPLALVALAALGAYWFFTTFERVPAKEKVGLTGEARFRHFLAAERFAERMGMKAREVRSLPELDALAPGGVLLVPNRRQSIDPPRLNRILMWVSAGGHLVAEAEYLGVDDPLLDAVGVARAAGKSLTQPLAVEAGGRKLRAVFHDAMALQPSGGEVRVRGGEKLYSIERGKGVVTVATSLNFARNALIGEHDHAELLWTLATLTPARELRVYFRPERLSLWGFLAANALPALVAAGALLLAWLWRIAPRFGPVAPDLPPARRRLLDHLRASGRYYWTKGLRSRLVVAARDAALRRIARVQPDFADAPPAERASRLSSLIGISQEEATRFLGAAGQMRGADFIRMTQHAQRIHSALEKGDR